VGNSNNHRNRSRKSALTDGCRRLAEFVGVEGVVGSELRKVNKPLILSDLRELRPRLLEDVSRLTLRWSREKRGEGRKGL